MLTAEQLLRRIFLEHGLGLESEWTMLCAAVISPRILTPNRSDRTRARRPWLD